VGQCACDSSVHLALAFKLWATAIRADDDGCLLEVLVLERNRAQRHKINGDTVALTDGFHLLASFAVFGAGRTGGRS
jgi:hypothetical protein